MNRCLYPQMQDVSHFLKVTTGPASEPITAAEAKAHCRIDTTDEDTYIGTLIAVAREMVEIDSERAFIEQTLTLTLDRFPEFIELRRCPIFDADDVVITYIDTAGDTQTLDPAEYRVDDASEPGRIAPAFGYVWPLTQIDMNAVAVEFTAGYADAAAVPAIAKHAIKLLVGHWHENREAVGKVGDEIKLAYDSLIQRLRWGGYR